MAIASSSVLNGITYRIGAKVSCRRPACRYARERLSARQSSPGPGRFCRRTGSRRPGSLHRTSCLVLAHGRGADQRSHQRFGSRVANADLLVARDQPALDFVDTRILTRSRRRRAALARGADRAEEHCRPHEVEVSVLSTMIALLPPKLEELRPSREATRSPTVRPTCVDR